MVSVITAYPLWVVMWSPVSYCKWRYLVRKLTSNRLLNHARRVDVCLTGQGDVTKDLGSGSMPVEFVKYEIY